MIKPEQLFISLIIVMLAIVAFSAPVLATDPTTELRIVKYANDRTTILNETTVDYQWLEANLPVYGDGVTRYYHGGPVFTDDWEEAYPGEPYDGWNPNEDINISILRKADFGAVMGTNLADICDYIGGASEAATIRVVSADGWSKTFPYSYIYEPDPRQGPAVLCWYNGNDSGPDAQTPQGVGYTGDGYDVGMRMIFFADTSTNPWGWHVFGNWDMHECWDEDDWQYAGDVTMPSAAGTSGKWINEVRIYSDDPALLPEANFTADPTSGTIPLTVTFADTSTGDPIEWSWDFGDGDSTNSTEQNPVHTYPAAGTYNVALTATNSAGSNTSGIMEITALEPGECGTTQVHVVKYASDNATILNEMTVSYEWLEENLPVNGDGVTHYYLQGTVSEDAWDAVFPYRQYDSLDPDERIESSFVDLGAVMGTNISDLCDYVGGAAAGDLITLVDVNDIEVSLPYEIVYEPEDVQGPAVLCWYSDDEGYTGEDYYTGMSLVFFADNSTNEDGINLFGNSDMENSWPEAYWKYNESLPSSAAASLYRIEAVRIFSQELADKPIPSFTANTTTGLPPLTVAFTDTSSGAPSSWSWDFGDGKTSGEQNPVHTYTAPSTYPAVYTVSLTAANYVGGNTTAESGCITITAGYANFTANRTGGLAPLTVAFTDTSLENPTAWEWDFDSDGTVDSTDQNPVHTYTGVGTYNVTLTVSGAFGSDTKVTSTSIERIRVLSEEDLQQTTTSLSIFRLANDNTTVLDNMTVDYQWLKENLPIQGDGVTRYYHQWWVFEEAWDEYHPGEPYNYQNPREDVLSSIVGSKGDLGPVKGTDLKDICDLVGGIPEGKGIVLGSSDGYRTSLQYNWVVDPDPRQGPAVLCWYNANSGYPDTGFTAGIRLIFFADNSTNPWGLHVFGIWDLHEAWGMDVDSTTSWSAKWVDTVYINTDDPATAPVADFTANKTSGDPPLTVAFNDTSTISPNTWYWNFGDGGNSTEQNPIHTFTEKGTYTVNLTATNNVGSNSTERTGFITVGDDEIVEKIIWGPYLTGTTTNMTVVSWKTNRSCTGIVEYADDDFYTANGDYEETIHDTTETELHHVTLENLTPGTLYHYRITADGQVTADKTFRTFPESGGFTFIVYGDTQNPANIGMVADRIAVEDPLFVLHTGDLVNAVESEDEWNSFFNSSRPMLANTTIYTVPGNHEYNNSVYYEITGMPEWYSFACSDARFAVLDDNEDYADIDAESAWLEQDLQTSANWKFVANHHPPYSSTSDRIGGWILLREYWGQTMKDAGVTAVFNGHVHAYERYLVDGITYLVTATGAGPLYELGTDRPDGYQNSLEHTLGYTKITVHANGTATGEFVKVALLSGDNTQVLEVYPSGTVFETYTLTAPGHDADLAVVSLEIPSEIKGGTAVNVNGTVKNIGNATSGACMAVLHAGGDIVDSAVMSPLSPNETAFISFTWTPDTSGETNLLIAVDPDETVFDINRTNNNHAVVVYVTGNSSTNSTLTLLPGWNFVSIPKALADGENSFSIFDEVDTADHSLLLYETEANRWVAMNTDDEFKPLEGIWIYANGTYEIPLHYASGSTQPPPAKNLVKGWNAVGFPDTVSGPAADALHSLDNEWIALIGYNSSVQAYDTSIIRGAEGRHGDEREMVPMQGYWLFMDEAETLGAVGE